MRAQEALLETAFQKIARIISGQYNVTVVVRGSRAYIDLKTRTIVLPSLDSDVVRGIEVILDGLLDHETGHAIYTDASVLESKPSPELHQVWNAIEDPRIEARLTNRYYGCGQNLAAANQLLVKRVLEKWPQMGAWQRLVTSICLVLENAGSTETFRSDEKMGQLFKLIEPEIEEARSAGTTQDALDVAKKILDKLASAQVPTKDEQQETGDVSAGDDGEEDDGDGNGGGEEAGDGEPSAPAPAPGEGGAAAEAEEGGDEEADAPGAAGAGEQEGSPDAGDDGAADAEHGAAEPAPGSQPGEEPADAPGVKPTPAAPDPTKLQEQAKAAQAELQAGEGGEPLTLEGLVDEHITEFLDKEGEGEPQRYFVFTEEFDTEKTYSLDDRLIQTALYEKLKGTVQRYIGTMASQLELALAARTQARWVGGELHGKRFDKRRMTAWMMGSDDERIYRVRVEGERLDTAVCMLWDCSGSMGSSNVSGNKAALARIAAIAFHEALLRVQIPHEVLGFNTGGQTSPQLAKLVNQAQRNGDDLAAFSRLDETDNRFVFVPFGMSDGRAICNITGGAANRDGEAVLWAARRLAARPEARKVLLVGSDGQPQGARYHGTEKRYLKEVVQKVTAAGIEVFGLGIMDESVKSYYPHWAVVKNAEELPRAVMAQLIRSLTGPTGMSDGAAVGGGAA